MSYEIDDGCTEACERSPTCKRCGLPKAPRGRDVPASAANSYCGWDCHGYNEEPTSGHLWPGELRRLRAEGGGQ